MRIDVVVDGNDSANGGFFRIATADKPGQDVAQRRKEMIEMAEACVPRLRPADYNYALLNFAAAVCLARKLTDEVWKLGNRTTHPTLPPFEAERGCNSALSVFLAAIKSASICVDRRLRCKRQTFSPWRSGRR